MNKTNIYKCMFSFFPIYDWDRKTGKCRNHSTESCSVMSDSFASQTVAHQAPLSMRFSRLKNWSGLPFPSPGDLPKAGLKPGSPALQADSLLSEPPGKQKTLKLIQMYSSQVICTRLFLKGKTIVPLTPVTGALRRGWEELPHVRGWGSGGECQAATAQEWPRRATLCSRSGTAAGRSCPTPDARGGGWEEQPYVQGAVAAPAQEGLEELSHVEGQEGWWWGDTPHPK